MKFGGGANSPAVFEDAGFELLAVLLSDNFIRAIP
jgi:hypothetical protein